MSRGVRASLQPPGCSDRTLPAAGLPGPGLAMPPPPGPAAALGTALLLLLLASESSHSEYRGGPQTHHPVVWGSRPVPRRSILMPDTRDTLASWPRTSGL